MGIKDCNQQDFEEKIILENPDQYQVGPKSEDLNPCRVVAWSFFFADGEDLVSVVGVGVVQCIRGNPNHILDQNVKPQPTRVFLCSIGNCHAQPTEAVPSFFYRSRNFG